MFSKKRILIAGLIFSAVFTAIILSSEANHPPLLTIDSVDADRFTGEWYVISNIPYFAEENKVATKTTYRKVGDHEYQDIYEYREGSFDNESESIIGKTICLNEEHTKWQSTFFGVFKFKFEILEVDPDYQIMLIGHRSRNYGWVMARDSRITELDYQRAMTVFRDNGYNINNFAKIPQHPSDLGQSGFQYVAN